MEKWQEILRDAVKGDSIRVSALRRIPQLKDCPRWDLASFLGRVIYRLPFASYDGGLVKYDGRIYYVNRAQIEALRAYVRWDVNKTLVVMED